MAINDSLLQCLKNLRHRYVPFCQTIVQWIQNKNQNYTVCTLNDVKSNFKKSETVFILGGGESINDITPKQWAKISEHDSIGMNWWPVHTFVPSYYYTNYPKDKYHFQKFQEILQKRLKRYDNTIFFISGNRAVQRGIHPRIVKNLFPANPICCFYEYEDPIRLDNIHAGFRPEYFENTLYYRGGLSLILNLMNKMEYKNIVLMGIDLINRIHFYDIYQEMKWQFTDGYSAPVKIKKKQKQSTMETKNDSKLPMDIYLYALNDMYYKPNGIKLFVGSSKSILAGRIPVYNFSSE